MCGIVSYIGTNQCRGILLEMLGKLDYRGYDSVGVATIEKGTIKSIKAIGCLNESVGPSRFDELKGFVGIGHTRWATHGKVTIDNAHPHFDCKNKIAVVHNGIINNFGELKEKLERHNHVFRSETDTEIIPHLIEEHYNGNFVLAFNQAIKELIGTYALVSICADEEKILLVRHNMPLFIGQAKEGYYISSDVLAFPCEVDNLVIVPENETIEITRNSIKVGFGEATIIPFNHNMYEASKGSHAHFMLKEIMEQPKSFLKAMEQEKEDFTKIALDILRAHNVILIGCGTSRFACVIGRYLFSNVARKFSDVIVGSELHYLGDAFDKNSLIIAVSQSGETGDILQGIEIAKKHGAKVISIVNKPYSQVERVSDATIFMKVGNEIGVAATKTFIGELVVFYCLAFAMANIWEKGLAELKEIPDKIQQCLEVRDEIKVVAEYLKKAEHIYYIGKGINFAIAGECALKLKEISYIHAESMSAGELKHGTLSLIEKGTPVIGLCPDDETFSEVVVNLYEAKARGAYIVGISDRNDSVYDAWLRIPKVASIYYPILTAVHGQLLAYETAVARNLNPDKPRNLAKSVTVT